MDNKKLIAELYFCAAQCTHCYDGCASEEFQANLEHCMMLDQDCSELCRLTGQLLERNSDSATKFLRLCSEICNDCAAECEKHNYDHCKRCAIVCRQCAEMCLRQEYHIET